MSNTLYGIPKNGMAGATDCNWHQYPMNIVSESANAVPGTVLLNKAFYRRCFPGSDSIEIVFTYRQTAAGTAGGGSYLFNLPQGLHIAKNCLPDADQQTSAPNMLGQAYVDGSGSGISAMVIPYGTPDYTKLIILVIPNNAATQIVRGGYYDFANTNLFFSFRAVVPIQEFQIS